MEPTLPNFLRPLPEIQDVGPMAIHVFKWKTEYFFSINTVSDTMSDNYF